MRYPRAIVPAVLALLLGSLGGSPTATAQCPSTAPRAEFGEAQPRHFTEQGGATLFHSICQGCHMPNAKGACGAACYPALAGDPALIAPGFAVRTVVNGLEGMPALGQMLSDQQIADVINYIRTSFGNHYPGTVTPAQVKAARTSTVTASATCTGQGVHGFFW